MRFVFAALVVFCFADDLSAQIGTNTRYHAAQRIGRPYGAPFVPVMPVMPLRGAYRCYPTYGSFGYGYAPAPVFVPQSYGSGVTLHSYGGQTGASYNNGTGTTLHSFGGQTGASYDRGNGVILHSFGGETGASYYRP